MVTNLKDFIETAKHLIAIAEKENAKVEKAAQVNTEQLELDLKGMSWPAESAKKSPAKKNILIILKGEFAYKEFVNRKDMVGFYKLPKQCYDNWPHFSGNISGDVGEDELIKAEAVWLSHFMAQAGHPIKVYGRYRTRATGGNLFVVNLEDLEKVNETPEAVEA